MHEKMHKQENTNKIGGYINDQDLMQLILLKVNIIIYNNKNIIC